MGFKFGVTSTITTVAIEDRSKYIISNVKKTISVKIILMPIYSVIYNDHIVLWGSDARVLQKSKNLFYNIFRRNIVLERQLVP